MTSIRHGNIRHWPLYWAGLLMLLIFLQGLLLATRIPLGQPPDELAHVSYVRDAIASPIAMPDYRSGEIINSSKKNYLGHPPLYYTALGLMGKLLAINPVSDYLYFRIVSIMFVAAGFLLCIASARNLGVGLFPSIVMGIACCATPMFAYLAASINNDTLMYLGVGLFLYGATRSGIEPGRIDSISALTLAGGLIVAVLTKATAAAFLVFFIVGFALFRLRSLPHLLRDRNLLTCLVVSGAVCGGYYLYSVATFGTLFPKPGPLYDLAPPADPISIATYVQKYGRSMLDRLPAIVSHASISPYSDTTKWAFYVMFFTPVVAWLAARPGAALRGTERSALALTDAFMFSLVATVTIHILYVRGSYLSTGLYAGWQPRYYFFALPFLWAPFFVCRPAIQYQAIVSVVFSLSTLLAFWSSVPITLSEHSENATRRAQAASERRNATTTLPPPGARPSISLTVLKAGKATGHIDEMSLLDGTLAIRGWTFDPSANRPARRIWVFANNRYLGSVEPYLQRPDVAAALSRPKARLSGFDISIRGIQAAILECEIEIASELSDGSLAMIRRRQCPDEPAPSP